jgi:hypothetical protein
VNMSPDEVQRQLNELEKNLVANNDPLVIKREPKLKVVRASVFEMTAGQVRAMCQSKPDHPSTPMFLKAVHAYRDDFKVSLELLDVQAFLQNKTTRTYEEVDEVEVAGVKIRTPVIKKEIVDLPPKADPSPIHVAAPTSPKKSIPLEAKLAVDKMGS